MRCVWKALVVMALASPATADECKIVWWDLFLPQSEVEFERTSEASALLTLTNAGKLESITFELAQSNLLQEDGEQLSLLLGTQTLVSGGLSNHVTVTLQPKANSWLVGFDSDQTVRTKDGKDFGGTVMHTGWLFCDQLKPWSLKN